MKNTIALALLVITLAACNSVESNREEILTVSSEYDTSIQKMRDLYGNLSNEMQNYNMYKTRISEGRDSATAFINVGDVLPDTELSKLQNSFNDYSAKFSALIQETSNYASKMNEQKPQIDAMKTALEGKSEYKGKVSENLKKMEAAIDETTGKLKTWEEQISALRLEIKTKYNEIAKLQGLPTAE